MQKVISSNQKYYINVAKKYREQINFYDIEQSMIEDAAELNSDKDKTICLTSITVIAPILISYVIYILRDAEKRKLKKLYFLSRDGYILCRIAKILCDEYKIKIECRYLYVSRLVLRLPLYYIDKNEAIKYLCEFSYKATPKIILERAGIDESNYETILYEINECDINRILSREELEAFGQKLINNKAFDEEAYAYSKAKFELISEYFIQEGIASDEEYAIVDVGWMGSMQRHITQILSRMNINNQIKGYYFGMFKDADYSNGDYECFYFSKDKNVKYRAFFNNNLFECMCSANHGMTVDYKKEKDGTIIPVTNEFKDSWNLKLQLDTIEKFAKLYSQKNKKNFIDDKVLLDIVKKLSIKFMMFPDDNEAEYYGSIPFCDDPTESYKLNLAEVLTKEELFKYNMFYKIYRNLVSKSKSYGSDKTFWINGSIKLSEVKYKKIFNLSCILSEYIHYLIIK